jgi:hypothetical protein
MPIEPIEPIEPTEPTEPTKPTEDDSSPARQRRDYRNFQSLIDKLVGDAKAKGEFDELAGSGKPLATSDDALVAEEDRLGFRMLKSHGFAPPWMEARQDVEQERGRVQAWLKRTNSRWATMAETSRVAARVEYRQLLTDLRRMILNYNLTAPAVAGQIDGIDIENEVRQLGQA